MADTAPETQLRSRSKTPFTLRSSCDRELCANLGADHVHDKKNSPIKKPTVETITEEKETPIAIPVVQRTSRTKKTNAKATSDYSSDDGSIEAAARQIAKLAEHNTAAGTKTSTTIITTSSKVVKSSGAAAVIADQQKQKEVTKSQTVTKSKRSASTKESMQNDSNVIFEQNLKLKTSTPRAAKNSSAAEITNGNGNGVNLEEHVPFKEYKEAGEYWNKFPKTDYTYSKLSPHRREIKPGIIAMPNMSRRSLEIHQSRVHEMSARDPAKESYFRSRYLSMATLLKTRSERAADNYYDSQDENDLSQFGRNGNGSRLSSYYTASRTTSTTFIRRIVTLITSIWLTISTSVTRIFRKSETPKWSTYSRVQSGEGLIRKWSSATWAKILSLFQYVYLAISSVLLWDTWCLKSSDTTNKRKKIFLLLLLILLPLLLLGGTFYYLEKPLPIQLPSLPSIRLPSLSDLPNLPKIQFPTSINLSLDHVIDPLTIKSIQKTTINQYNNVLNVSSEYLDYIKAVTVNSATELKRIWTENVKF